MNEAQGFCYLASNLLRYMQVKRYIKTMETSEIRKDYEDILSYSQRSTDLLHATFLNELNRYSTEEIKEQDPMLFTAVGLYVIGLNHQIIAYCCLYDLTKNSRYLNFAYDVSCLLKITNKKDLNIKISRMKVEMLKKRLRYRAIAYANVDSLVIIEAITHYTHTLLTQYTYLISLIADLSSSFNETNSIVFLGTNFQLNPIIK